MGKYIKSEDGSMMLVSDDTPDDVVEYSGVTGVLDTSSTVPSVMVTLVCGPEDRKIPCLLIEFEQKRNQIRLQGSVTTPDYFWLVTNFVVLGISQIEFAGGQILYTAEHEVKKLVGTQTNTLTTDIDLLLRKHT